jgi:hypothetical protein
MRSPMSTSAALDMHQNRRRERPECRSASFARLHRGTSHNVPPGRRAGFHSGRRPTTYLGRMIRWILIATHAHTAVASPLVGDPLPPRQCPDFTIPDMQTAPPVRGHSLTGSSSKGSSRMSHAQSTLKRPTRDRDADARDRRLRLTTSSKARTLETVTHCEAEIRMAVWDRACGRLDSEPPAASKHYLAYRRGRSCLCLARGGNL